jgi:hypothetical protein
LNISIWVPSILVKSPKDRLLKDNLSLNRFRCHYPLITYSRGGAFPKSTIVHKLEVFLPGFFLKRPTSRRAPNLKNLQNAVQMWSFYRTNKYIFDHMSTTNPEFTNFFSRFYNCFERLGFLGKINRYVYQKTRNSIL